MNKSSQLGSVSTSDLIDAKLEGHQLCGSKHCPGCGHKLQAKPDWVGLPAGLKFDPTDQELIEHLEAKVEGMEAKSHPLIDEFIPTIEGEDGICYTHPEKLPGVTRDGLSRHFFHRPSKAYTTGTRKRRKIQMETVSDLSTSSGETRWHKTGKTRPVMVNGKQKGCKKILVLYTNFGKNRKPEKTNWVMHQYHLGQHEEEKEGELVVSKIFYQTQPRQCNWSERSGLVAANISAGFVCGDHQGMAANSDQIRIRESGSGSGSCSSSNKIHQSDDFSMAASVPSYAAMDQFSFLPFKNEGGSIREASIAREVVEVGGGGTCQEREIMEQQHPVISHVDAHHRHQIAAAATAAYHICIPSHSISTIISPPTVPLHHHPTSINILEHHHHPSLHVPRIILPTENFQQGQEQQQQQQHHHKLGGSSASGLEELIMGCTSTDIKEESSMANEQEAEWLKYSSFWPNPDYHHG